jgi:hypothetical protein
MRDFANKIFNWVKENKLTAALTVIVLYFLFYRRPVLLPQLLGSSPMRKANVGVSTMESLDIAAPMAEMSYGRGGGYYPSPNVAPRPDVEDRMVITNSSMSLQVKSVRDAMDSIKMKTRDLGGYVVDTSVTTPEFGESGNMVVRVPSDSLDSTLEYFRNLAVKVVSENISGTDITDQYIDIQERIDRLEATKARFEQILNEAETVEEILKVQREIFNLQDQIDNYKGRLAYMEGASSTTLIRIYLSTDELGLPYTPSQAWRPQVVFKQATRSMLMTLIEIGNAAIWIAVYLPLIAAAVIVFILIKRVIKRKNQSSQN